MEKVILFIPGMWCAREVWNNYAGFFRERGYKTASPNLRYHGEYVKPHPKLGKVSIRDYAEDLCEIARGLEKRYGAKPVIIGFSMGGLLAQILAGRNMASGLVLLSPAAPSGIFSLEPSVIKSFWSSITDVWAFWNKPVKLSLADAKFALFGRLSEYKQLEVYGRMCHESGRAIFEIGFWPLDFRFATKVKTKKVRCPIFIAAGEEDAITPVKVVKKIAEKYKCAKVDFRIYPGHAHWLLAEKNWRQIAIDIDFWLKRLDKIEEKSYAHNNLVLSFMC